MSDDFGDLVYISKNAGLDNNNQVINGTLLVATIYVGAGRFL